MSLKKLITDDQNQLWLSISIADVITCVCRLNQPTFSPQPPTDHIKCSLFLKNIFLWRFKKLSFPHRLVPIFRVERVSNSAGEDRRRRHRSFSPTNEAYLRQPTYRTGLSSMSLNTDNDLVYTAPSMLNFCRGICTHLRIPLT